jgi:hypothetical protein
MRNRLKYGVPAAAGLGVAGMAAGEDENPAAVLGAGAAGALGAAAGLVGARQLAGKYNPQLIMSAQRAVSGAGNVIGDYGRNLPERSKVRRAATGAAADIVDAIDTTIFGIPGQQNAAIPFPNAGSQRTLGKVAAAGLVPGAAAAAGLGGVAAGRAVGAIGQAMGIDPEAPGSSNTMGSRLNMQSYAASQAMGGSLLPYAMGVGM